MSGYREQRGRQQILRHYYKPAALGGQGLRQKLWLKKMLHSGLVNVIASDSHSTGQRRTRRTEAYTRLCRTVGSRAARQSCCLTPLRILGVPLKSGS